MTLGGLRQKDLQIRNTAVTNVIMKFLKLNLKMDERTRNNLNIMEIYPNDNEDFDTLYIKCKNQDDIGCITSHAKNLPKNWNEDEERPTLVTHIPTELYNRYKACEKLLWAIRTQNKGKYQTNLRLGKTDIILRFKEKTDPTPWGHLPIIKIPPGIPLSETSLLKGNMKTSQLEPTTKHPIPIYKETETEQQITSGTVSGTLKQRIINTEEQTNNEESSNNKRKMSPEQEIKHKTPRQTDNEIETSNRWETRAADDRLTNNDQNCTSSQMEEDNHQTSPQQTYPSNQAEDYDLSKYKQITRVEAISCRRLWRPFGPLAIWG